MELCSVRKQKDKNQTKKHFDVINEIMREMGLTEGN